jgi:hypothetical protein
MYRLRVTNRAGGAVEVSSNGGTAWERLGKVTRAATAAGAASDVIGVAPPGAIAAVTPSHLIVRVPPGKTGNRSLRVLAKDEEEIASAISTDIPTRGSIFRCIAPYVGSPVRLQRGEKLEPLPAAYAPQAGDRLVILVNAPAGIGATTVTIENREDGEVVLSHPNGAPRVLAKVKQPLRGIGRYAGTERAGSGAVVSWSPTAVLVCTAGTLRGAPRNGQPAEERGGFVIQPSEPPLRGTTHPASQLLLEAVAEEGEKPVVSHFFGLPAPISTGDPLDISPTRVEVRIDGRPWQPCPDLRGTLDNAALLKAIRAALGEETEARDGITHLRLIYGTTTEEGLRRRLAATPLAPGAQRGRVVISANVTGGQLAFVEFYLDGDKVFLANVAPYNWAWDTTRVGNGEHLIEIRGLNSKLATVSTAVTRVIVDN